MNEREKIGRLDLQEFLGVFSGKRRREDFLKKRVGGKSTPIEPRFYRGNSGSNYVVVNLNYAKEKTTTAIGSWFIVGSSAYLFGFELSTHLRIYDFRFQISDFADCFGPSIFTYIFSFEFYFE